jgi:hypothetical protein
MTYKFSDILRMIIPGLYFITISLGISVDLEIIRIDEATPFLKLLTSTFANVIVILLPFLGYIVGYIINICSSYMERLVYRIKKMKRPSQIVLGFNEDYRLKDVSKILAHYGINEVNEQTAHKAFLLAKEEISQSDRINTHFEQSTFARNIAGVQLLYTLIAFVSMFFGGLYSLISFVISAVLCVICLYNWRRQSCVYAKYVFSELEKNM